MAAVKACLSRREKCAGTAISYGGEINCHHNYAALEHHYGKNVWAHRKGTARARMGKRAVIPGAMGSYNYVVEVYRQSAQLLFFRSRSGTRLFAQSGDASV